MRHSNKPTIWGRAIAGRTVQPRRSRTQTIAVVGDEVIGKRRLDVNVLRRRIVHLSPDSTANEREHWLQAARKMGCYLRVRKGVHGELPPAPDKEERGTAMVTEVERCTRGKWADVFQVDAPRIVLAKLCADRIVSHWHTAIHLALPRSGSGQAPAQATERAAFKAMKRERGQRGVEFGEAGLRREAKSEVYGPVRPLDQTQRLDVARADQAQEEAYYASLPADPRCQAKRERLEAREAEEKAARKERGERGPIRETRPSSRARLAGKLQEMAERAEAASKARAIRFTALETECPSE